MQYELIYNDPKMSAFDAVLMIMSLYCSENDI